MLNIGRATNVNGVAVPVSVLSVEMTLNTEAPSAPLLHAYGMASLEPGEFTFDNATLTAASVRNTLELTKDDGTMMAVTVDVRWTAWGNYDSGKTMDLSHPARSS